MLNSTMIYLISRSKLLYIDSKTKEPDWLIFLIKGQIQKAPFSINYSWISKMKPVLDQYWTKATGHPQINQVVLNAHHVYSINLSIKVKLIMSFLEFYWWRTLRKKYLNLSTIPHKRRLKGYNNMGTVRITFRKWIL